MRWAWRFLITIESKEEKIRVICANGNWFMPSEDLPTFIDFVNQKLHSSAPTLTIYSNSENELWWWVTLPKGPLWGWPWPCLWPINNSRGVGAWNTLMNPLLLSKLFQDETNIGLIEGCIIWLECTKRSWRIQWWIHEELNVLTVKWSLKSLLDHHRCLSI